MSGTASGNALLTTPVLPSTVPDKTTAGAQLFDRRFSVVVADASGKGLDLSALRSVFVIRQFDIQTPNSLDLHITNLSRTTAARMMKEFTRVQISAGYPGIYGIIFDGTILQARYGRDSGTDTFLHIVATDGDRAHNYAVVSTTLPAGSKPQDAHRAALTAMNPYGVTEGYTDPALNGAALPRGKTLFGMARDILRNTTESTNTSWSITHGRVDVISRTGYLPTEAVVITAQTGMIGLPVVTPEGIVVRTLLNPLIRIGQRIKLDNASLQRPAVSTAYDGQQQFAATYTPGLINADGQYRVLAVDHYGDTRGSEWYSEMACVGLALSTTNAAIQRGRSTSASPADTVPPAPVAPLTPAATPPTAGPAPAPAAPPPSAAVPVTPIGPLVPATYTSSSGARGY